MTILASGSPTNWASTYKLTFPVIPPVGKGYPSGAYPTHVVIDRGMVVQWISPPDLDYWYDEDIILAVIKPYL